MTIIATNKPLEKRRAFDFYPTPPEFARAALAQVPTIPRNPNILDPGAGCGAWGAAARQLWHGATITGIELRDVPRPQAYNFWINQDARLIQPQPVFDCVIGNPPYVYAEEFVRLGMQFLAPGGCMIYLLRLAFLEGQGRARDLWRRYPPETVYVCSQRPSFTGNGKTDATAYGVYVWREGYRGKPHLDWLDTSTSAARAIA